jgi:predicted nucleic acid-binding protein
LIHLDTSFLIRGMVVDSVEDKRLRRWLRARETIRVSAIVWAEFLCGPVPAWVAEDAAELFGEPLPFDGMDATLASQLFNVGGRRRGTMLDCMVASVAIRATATLATANVADFKRFAPLGLMLASA